MPQPTNTFATNDQVGIREDLADKISMITPAETPFWNMVGSVKVTSTLHEHQTDSLAAAANNAVIEGDDVTPSAATPTTRLNNVPQLSHKHVRVSSRARAVTTAGRADELTYQMEVKRAVELRRDVETACLLNKPKVTGDDSTAPEAAGVPAWITTNTDFGASGADPTGDGTNARTDGTQRAFKESQVKNVMLQCFNSGGFPDVMMMGGFNRQIASGFSDGKVVQQQASVDKLKSTFKVYESDYGTLKLIPNRFQRARDSLILEMDKWKKGLLQDFHSFDLAKTGHSEARVVALEWTIECTNEAASGIVADLTTS